MKLEGPRSRSEVPCLRDLVRSMELNWNISMNLRGCHRHLDCLALQVIKLFGRRQQGIWKVETYTEHLPRCYFALLLIICFHLEEVLIYPFQKVSREYDETARPTWPKQGGLLGQDRTAQNCFQFARSLSLRGRKKWLTADKKVSDKMASVLNQVPQEI